MDLAAEYTAMRPALMSYCKLGPDDLADPDDEKDFREAFDSAVSYMEDAGVKMPESDPLRRAKYNRCLKALVQDDWDNRGTQAAGPQLVDNPAFRRRLKQLQMTEPVSDSDTGAGE